MTDFTFPEYQRHDKKIAALEKAIRADEALFEDHTLWHPFWSAEGNANDTVYVELAQPESELSNLFWDTLSSALSCTENKAIVRWYADHGVFY